MEIQPDDDMKANFKTSRCLAAISAVALTLAGMNAAASEFSGSIAFGATGINTDNPVLPSATDFSLTGAFVTGATGEYSTLGVATMTPVMFNGFKFNPAVASVNPLWTFTVGSTVFSFDATSVKSQWVPGIGGGEWDITGDGLASITGFDETPGSWTVNLSQSGNLSIAFDSTASVQPRSRNAPDTASSFGLLGGALGALGLCARKFKC